MSEAITLEERYAKAMRSSHLEVQSHRRGDVDTLIAAGWCDDTLGTLLYRLASEFDSVRAEIRQKNLNHTEFALILMRLKTLPSAKQALGRYACIQATKQKFMEDDRRVMSLMGQVLSMWLDPNCHNCDGRGVVGGYGSLQAVCRECGGSRIRLRDKQGRPRIGNTDEQKRFAWHMLCRMDRLTAVVEEQMRRFLRGRA